MTAPSTPSALRALFASALTVTFIACGGSGGDPCDIAPGACPLAGATRCSASSVQACEANADGCLAWATVATCAEGATCDDSGATALCTGGVGCGTNTIDGAEVCDGVDLDGETCPSLGFAGGTLACSADCDAFDTSACDVITYAVTECRLQYPVSASVAVGEAFATFVRVQVEGLTDLTEQNDPAPALLVQVGYGLDGSDPSEGAGAPWTWVAGTPNASYGPGAPAFDAAQDEYRGEITIDGAGIYDFAGRASGDAGDTWVYCDRDGLAVGGYMPEQAGHAEVGQ